MNIYKAALCLMLTGAVTGGFAQGTYTWNGSVSTDYAVAGNWTPTRTTPNAGDILNFTSGGTVTVTNVTASQTIAELHVTNSTLVDVSVPAARTLNIAGGPAAADLEVAAGSTLRYSGGFAVTIALSSGAKGLVDGNVIFTSTGNTIPHRLTGINDGTAGITFNSGSTFQFAPGGSGAGNPFGNAANASVLFKSGSIAYQGGTTTGPSAGTGSAMQAGTLPNAVITWEAGSTYYNWTSVIAGSGRTYANVIIDNRGGTMAPGGGTSMVMDNLTIKSTSVGNLNWDGSANPVARINGNLTVEAGGLYQDNTGGADVATANASSVEVGGNISLGGTNVTLKQDGSRFYNLNGTGTQDISLSSTINFNSLTVNKASGNVRLLTNATATGILNLTAGEVDTNGFTLTASADGAANVVRTNGFVRGTLARSVNAANTGSRLFPVGTAGNYSGLSIDITGAGTGTGTVTVSSTAGDHPNVSDAAGTLDRHWSITPSGIDLSSGAATLTFNYAASDVSGTVAEASMVAGRYTGSAWQIFPGTTINTGSRTATVTGVSTFSDWTLGNSAAVPVQMSGFTIE